MEWVQGGMYKPDNQVWLFVKYIVYPKKMIMELLGTRKGMWKQDFLSEMNGGEEDKERENRKKEGEKERQ